MGRGKRYEKYSDVRYCSRAWQKAQSTTEEYSQGEILVLLTLKSQNIAASALASPRDDTNDNIGQGPFLQDRNIVDDPNFVKRKLSLEESIASVW